MIIRDADGKICIINRKDCKNDASYYEKIFEIKKSFIQKLETQNQNSKTNVDLKHLSQNIHCEDEDE
jgi:hypothetical protein